MSDSAQDKLDSVEAGLEMLLLAIHAGDPLHELQWRVEEELRIIRRSITERLPDTQKTL